MRCYRFGEFVLDVGRRELLRSGSPVALTPKEFQTLLLLVEAEGRAVAREELIQAIWPDSVVGDSSLGRNISALRRHLGAEAIVSVARFGYRFTPEVQKEEQKETAPRGDEASVETPVRSGWLPWYRRIAVAGLALAAVLAAWFVVHYRRVSAASRSMSPEAAYWDRLGSEALQQGTYFKASRAFERAKALSPQAAAVHLHLAQAAFLMDFVETAQKEVLAAESEPGYQGLSAIDRLRLDALRALILQDYETAAQKYEQAVASGTVSERPALLQELGLVYKRQGRLDKAEASFTEAARLEPINPGPELALGGLDYLERKWDEAGVHYDRAAQMFEAASNLEGTAEVHYQRALTAYVQAKYGDEEDELKKSLEAADSLKDSNLRLRCMGTMSTMYRWSGHLDLSERYAEQVAQEAVSAGSMFFYAEGVILKANVAVALHDAEKSQRLLRQGADLAVKNGNARQTANVYYSLADFYGGQGDYAQEIAYADLSAAQYRAYGSMDGVADATLLRISGEEHSGEIERALTDAQALLATSERTHSDLFAEDTEVELGIIYSAMKDEPEALKHFLRAQAWSRKTGSQPELKAMHVAGSYARLGRWKEARTVWSTVPEAAKHDPDNQKTYMEVAGLMKGH